MCTFIGAGIKSKQSTSVVNILRNLVESDRAEVYIPENYAKESRYTTDSKVHFIDSPVRVYDLVGNQERFNVSLKASVPVMVDTENGQQRKKVFRNYTVVRDGILNLIDINVRFLEREFFESYKNVNLVDGEYDLNRLYTIHLADVPVVSCDWAKPNQYGLVDMLKEDAQLSETLKVVRKAVKALKETVTESFADSEYYTEEKGVEIDKPKKEVNCIVYELPEYKPQATVDDSRLTDYANAKAYQSELTKKQADLRFAIRCVVMATEYSANKGFYNWSESTLLPRSKNKFYQVCDTVDKSGNGYKLRRLEYKKMV
jgi:hypothetical protein